jgi:hypothetical protein
VTGKESYREVNEVEVERSFEFGGPFVRIQLWNGPRLVLDRTVTQFCAGELAAGREIELRNGVETWIYSRVTVLGGRFDDQKRAALLRRRKDGSEHEYLLLGDFLDSLLVRSLDR